MRHITTTISRHNVTHHAQAAVFWIFAGIIMMVAFGDALTVLVAAFAVVTMVSWVYREVEHRLERRAKPAPVTHLRPELTVQRDLKRTSAHASWRGPRAA
jgi:hypothetical protein